MGGWIVPELKCAEIFGLEIRSDDVVVDVGAGSGNDCMIAASIGAEVIALNIDRGELDRLADRMRGTPARSFRTIQLDCNAGPIPLPDGTASVVIAKEIMEHLDDPARFLGELARIGKPGARYLIAVPDASSESLLKLVAPPDFWQKPNHINIFEHDPLDRLLADAGLVVERRQYTGFYWAMLWTFRLAIGTDWFPGHPGTPPSMLAAWDEVWKGLEAAPNGRAVIDRLDELVPKSQVVQARKPAAVPRGRRWIAHLPGIGAVRHMVAAGRSIAGRRRA